MRHQRPGRASRGWFALGAIIATFWFAGAVAAVAAPTDGNEVIVPAGSAKAAAPAKTPAAGAFTLVAVVLLAGAGGWLLWRGRGTAFAKLNRGPKNLAIEEMRSLGNRQFLVVASYRDQKFLLGVCPGRIDLLSPLAPGADTSKFELPPS